MIVSGLGTKDSPLLLDDDSESEVVIELIGTPPSHFADPDDTQFNPRLSPRPGTFLSNVARLNLSKSSARSLKKYREDLRQLSHGRKRKRTPTPAHMEGGPRPDKGHLESTNAVVDVMVVDTEREAETQHTLLNPPEKPSQSRIGPPAKKPKHNHEPNNELILLPDRPPPATVKASTCNPIPKTSSALGPTSCPNPPRPHSKHSRFPGPTAIPSPTTSIPHQFDPTSIPFPMPPQDFFAGQPMSMMQEPFPVMNMDFDPMLWAMSMSMNGFSMPATPFPLIPPIGLPLPPKPAISEKPQPNLRPPPSKLVKSEPKHQILSSTTSTKSQDTTSEHLPARPPYSNEKPAISRQRPFTLRSTDRPMNAPVYLPIGKPDFRDIHGVFPIIPPLMLPALSSAASASFTPDLDRTLVLENLPKGTCSKVWIQNWCMKACGFLPELSLLGPRRALVMFKQPEHAICAWASPRLGVDENVFRDIREDVITAYWYRPDAVKERQLVIGWKSSKKMVTEIREMLALPVDESIVAGVLTEHSNRMLELSQVQPQEQTSESRFTLHRMAEQMGFHERLAGMIGEGFTEEDILKWEQKEIAWIERERRLKTLPRNRIGHSEVGNVGGDEERENEGDKSSFRSVRQTTVLAQHQNQRNDSNASVPTSGTDRTNAVPGPSSVSEPPLASTSSLLPTKISSLPKPQLPASSHITTTREKSDSRFGHTAWKSPEFTISSSSTNTKPLQTCPHPERSPSEQGPASHQNEQLTANTSPSMAAGPPMKHSPAPNISLPSTLPGRPKPPGIPPCNVTTSPINNPTVSLSTNGEPSRNSPATSLPHSVMDDQDTAAESLESQTVSRDVAIAIIPEVQADEASLASNLRSSAATLPPKPVDTSGSIEPPLVMASTSVSSESVSILNPAKAAPSNPAGTSGSSLASTPVLAVAPGFGDDSITDQRIAGKVENPAAMTSQLTLVPTPRPPPGIPLKVLQELKRVLATSTEERQKFLDNEFKATKLLMDQWTTITCKKERKQVTDSWKQKIRIIDEVTRSIRNDAKVWYSQEMKTWIRMRWPGPMDTPGILVIDVED